MRGMNRRAFIRLCGCVCCGAALALAGCDNTADKGAAAPSVTSTADAATADSTAVRCPRGQRWDPYPGRCHSYRDTNGNGYCDWSEPA